MQYIQRLTRSFVVLGLLAFVLGIGFSGIALADEKAAETKASDEMKAEGEKKGEDEGETKASDDTKAEGEKKAEGSEKAPAAE